MYIDTKKRHVLFPCDSAWEGLSSPPNPEFLNPAAGKDSIGYFISQDTDVEEEVAPMS